MTETELLNCTKRKKVTFSFYANGAKSVFVSGDFCGWDTKKYPMKLKSDNNWKTQLVLPEGQYQYKFLVDGQWINDPLNEKVCENCFGTQNNVLSITQK